MMKFYEATFPGQPAGSAVVVAEDTTASILLRWVPNTGLWHRATELENDFLHGEEGGTYQPITPEDAGELLKHVPRLDRRRTVAARLLARYNGQPAAEKRTNAEMGLSVKNTGLKPMSSPGLPQLLEQAAAHRQWRTISRYGPDPGSAARQLISTWRNRPLTPQSPPLELRTTTTGDNTLVQARQVSKTTQGTLRSRTTSPTTNAKTTTTKIRKPRRKMTNKTPAGATSKEHT